MLMMPTENRLINRKATEVTKPARKSHVFLLPFFYYKILPVASFSAGACKFW